jgi:hypothetical protein
MKKVRATNKRCIKTAQAGISNVQLMIYLLVGAIVLVGGMGGIKYIDKSKVNNELAELTDLKASTISLSNARGGNFTGVTLGTLAGLDFFPRNRVTGTGAATAVTNQWKGAVTAVPATLNVTNDALAFTYTGYPASACKAVVIEAASVVNRIVVGTTQVKAPGGVVNEDTLITACDAGADNNSIVWTISR